MKKLVTGLSLALFFCTAAVVHAADGEAIYKSACAGCHGATGEKGAALNSQSPDDLMKKLKGYADGSFGGEKKAVMVNVVKKHNEEELKAVADFIGKK